MTPSLQQYRYTLGDISQPHKIFQNDFKLASLISESEKLCVSYRISSEDLILALLARLFSSFKLYIAN